MTKLTTSFTACTTLILLGVGVITPVNAAYIFTDLGTLGGTYYSYAYGINDNGKIVGSSSVSAYTSNYATLWNGSPITNLGGSANAYNFAYAINNDGKIVGARDFIGDNSTHHATLWSGNTITDLGTLGGNVSYAYGINDNGKIVGMSATAQNGRLSATVWEGNTITELGTLGGLLAPQSTSIIVGKLLGIAGSAGVSIFMQPSGRVTPLPTLERWVEVSVKPWTSTTTER